MHSFSYGTPCASGHHKQQGGCLQFAQMWLNCWQLWHCKGILVLYVSTLIVVWQRLGSQKISWDFAVLGKVLRNRMRFGYYSLRWMTGSWHLFEADNVKTWAHQSIRDVFCRSTDRELLYYRVGGFQGFRVQGKVGEVRWDLTAAKSVKVFVVILVPFLVLRYSKFSWTTLLRCFWNWMRLVVIVVTLGGSLPVRYPWS
jgi:hypothetical protein